MSLYSEDELLPLSALADLLFCERRAALHQIEGFWEDNLFTIEGTHLHKKVDEVLPPESRGPMRVVRGLLLRSLSLGLSGKADVVELHRFSGQDKVASQEEGQIAPAVVLPGLSGFWWPYPVDYKRGRLRHEEGFEAQLCAQALCLEEMLGGAVPEGAVYYGKPRRRLAVVFDTPLRAKTQAAAYRLHELVASGQTPPARYEKKCDSCSLLALCLPRVTEGRHRRVASYLSSVALD